MLPYIELDVVDGFVGIINAAVFVVNALSWKFILVSIVVTIVLFFVAAKIKKAFGFAVVLVMFTPTLCVITLFVTGVITQVFLNMDAVASTPPTSVTATGNVSQWLPDIKSAVDGSDVPASFVVGIMTVESAGNPDPVSNAGALGLMQVMPATAAESYICSAADLTNPQENIACGVTYIEWSADVLNIDMTDGLTDSEATLLAMAYHGGATGALTPRPIDKRYATAVVSAMSMSHGSHEYPNVIAALYCGGGWTRTGTKGVHDGGAVDYASVSSPAASYCSPIDGVVSERFTDGLGNTVLRIQGNGEFFEVWHGTYTVNVGEVVMAGQGIGEQGNFGNSSHAHAHARYTINGIAQQLP